MSSKGGHKMADQTVDKPLGSMKGLFWAGWRTSVEIEMPSSVETVGGSSSYSSHTTGSGPPTAKGRGQGDTRYHGADAWWTGGDLMHPEVVRSQNSRHAHNDDSPDSPFGKANDDDTWDISDSIVDLYKEVNKYDGVHNHSPVLRTGSKVDTQEWIQEDTSHGFVHVFKSDLDTHPKMFPCNLSTTAQKLCIQCGMPPNSLHVQLNGDIIRRLEPFDSPLAIQNEYLQSIGYTDQRKIQEIGAMEDLAFLVKFYAGKPVSDSTYSRNQLTSYAYVRKGKLIHQWVRRLCVITGTRLLIYRDKTKSGNPTIVQLAKGSVEEVKNIKGHDHVLKLTSTLQGERSVYLAFDAESDFNKWFKKTKKATAKLPTKADLSNCHLEFLPETVFINDGLEMLNLRHNVLKERPIEEDIYTIGWLDDLPRFTNLRSLNLADNDLGCFPVAVCKMRTLTELNLASNRIEDIPPTIADLENLQILHLHNNQLTYLPEEMSRMRHLVVLVLAFNHFTGVPHVLLYSQDSVLNIDSLIMAGNRIEKLPHDVLNKIHHIKKVDFRMNKLTLSPNETAKFHLLQSVTHLDIRDNSVTDLDVRPLRNLEYLNCERNKIHSLQVSGGAIKTLYAMRNEMTSFNINPKPEWLATLDVSHNKLETLPSWLSDCFFLVQLNASHNLLTTLPDRLLCETQKLRVLRLSHNCLTCLPDSVGSTVMEEISLEHNQLTHLPNNLFLSLPKLRYLCLTHNHLESLPEPNENIYQNKIQELYLSANQLRDDVILQVVKLQKLKILHLAYNRLTEIHDRHLRKLENLHELNISGNYLRHLPRCVGKHAKLQALRSNANLLKELPDFRYSPNLKVLEVGSNRLMDISVTSLMASNVNLLDISGNPEMQVSSMELRGIKTKKKVCMVDIKGQNRSLLDLRTAGLDDLNIPWQSGLSQTSGMRNKLSVSIVNRPRLSDGQEGLFAVFDGGRNDEVSRILAGRVTGLLEEEIKHSSAHSAAGVSGDDYLKYTILAAHRKLKGTGQKIGATGAICHIRKSRSGSGQFELHVANVGDVEVVVCRRGEARVLTELFTIDQNKQEMERICKAGGIVTEDNKINGVTHNTRLLGSSYLFPYVVPDPHVTTTTLQPDDQLIIIANQGLWKCMTYQETINEIINIPDPVLAAKKLQDLAQGYRSQENIGVLVVRLMLSSEERNKMRCMLQEQFEEEQKLLAELRIRDIEREETRKRMELEEQNEMVPMDVVKMKGARRRKQVDQVFHGNGVAVDSEIDGVDGFNGEHSSGNSDPPADWELMLQRRLTEEVKDKELIHAMKAQNDYDPYFPVLEPDENWSTTTKLKGQMKERVVTLPPKDDPSGKSKTPPPVPQLQRRQIIPEAHQLSTESLEFRRELKHPLNVDRDAVLFHNMQIHRNKNHNQSSRSIDSIQSDPAFVSMKEMPLKEKKSSSHSIEVLLHQPTLHGPSAQHTRQVSFGGSHKLPKDETNTPHTLDKDGKGDSCPIDMTDRLKMLEQKGFLPKDQDKTNQKETGKNARYEKKISLEEFLRLSGNKIGEIEGSGGKDSDSGTDVNGDSDQSDDDFQYFPGYETVKSVQMYKNRTQESKSPDVDVQADSGQPTIKIITKQKPDSASGGSEDSLGGVSEGEEDFDSLYAKVIKGKTNGAKDMPSKLSDEPRVSSGKGLAGMEKALLYNGRDSPILYDSMTSNSDQNKSENVSPVPKPLHLEKVVPHSTKTKRPPPIPVDAQVTISNTRGCAPSDSSTNRSFNETLNAQADGQSYMSSSKQSQPQKNNTTSTTNPGRQPENAAPPVPPRMPLKSSGSEKSDINSNSIRSLEDLIAYNRLQQQQKLNYKASPKSAPVPPPKVPETSMISKTASQRSIIITYL